MRSLFRRRRKRARKRQPEPEEVIDWEEGQGKSLMSALRGDSAAGAGFGAGMFEDLHAAFSGAKRVQIDEKEAEKMRVNTQHSEGAPPDDLDSGVIRIKHSPAPPEDEPTKPGPDAS